MPKQKNDTNEQTLQDQEEKKTNLRIDTTLLLNTFCDLGCAQRALDHIELQMEIMRLDYTKLDRAKVTLNLDTTGELYHDS